MACYNSVLHFFAKNETVIDSVMMHANSKFFEKV